MNSKRNQSVLFSSLQLRLALIQIYFDCYALWLLDLSALDRRMWVYVRSGVQKFPAWYTKAAPNGKMLWGIYSAIYGEVNVSVEKCVEMKGDYVEK